MRQEDEEQVITFLRKAVEQCADQLSTREQWGHKHSDNEIMAMEIRNAMELNEDQLRFLSKQTTENGFEVQAAIGSSITTWNDLMRAIYLIIGLVAESFLLIQTTVDETSLKYWFVTGSFVGSSAHGHIGVIRISKEDVLHLHPEYFNRYKSKYVI